jgi:DNA-directed RNA polymerase specialized sigma24 family protein
LKHAEDLPYARIGEILGITENAVQVRIFRARKMHRKKLGLPEGAVSLK